MPPRLRLNSLPRSRLFSSSCFFCRFYQDFARCRAEAKQLRRALGGFSFHRQAQKLQDSFHKQYSESIVPRGTRPISLSPEDYHCRADAYIDTLVTKLEDLQEEREDVDVEYSSGVLTLVFPPAGTYVLNKQPPNKQIWLSSPISGPKRYDYVSLEGKSADWIYLRDGTSLSCLLREELGLDLHGREE